MILSGVEKVEYKQHARLRVPVFLDLGVFLINQPAHIYIYIYICVCVCVSKLNAESTKSTITMVKSGEASLVKSLALNA